MLYSKYAKLTFFDKLNERGLSSEYVCVVCNLVEIGDEHEILANLLRRHGATTYDLYESDATAFPSGEIFKTIWKLFRNGGDDVKASLVELLPSLANHVPDFHCHDVSRDVANIAGNKNPEVRKSFCKVVVRVLKFTQVIIIC